MDPLAKETLMLNTRLPYVQIFCNLDASQRIIVTDCATPGERNPLLRIPTYFRGQEQVRIPLTDNVRNSLAGGNLKGFIDRGILSVRVLQSRTFDLSDGSPAVTIDTGVDFVKVDSASGPGSFILDPQVLGLDPGVTITFKKVSADANVSQITALAPYTQERVFELEAEGDTLTLVLDDTLAWLTQGTISSGGGGGGGVTSVTAGAGLTSTGTTAVTLNVGAGDGIVVGADTVSLEASGVVAGAYTNASVTVDTYGRVTSAASNPAAGGTGSLIFVSQKSDFPAAVAGVITLPAGSSWFITDYVDLGTDRLVADGTVSILGTSPEISVITSNPGDGVAILESPTTLTLHFLGIACQNNSVGVLITSALFSAALDWSYVNFTGTGRSLILQNVDNGIFSTIGFLAPVDGVLIEGTINTLAFSDSLFAMIGGAGKKALSFAPGAISNRRFRVRDCSVIATPDNFGYEVADSNILNSESFILKEVFFSGGSADYVSPMTYLSDKARWVDTFGVPITARLGELYWEGNATSTVIATSGTFVKIQGTSIAGAFNQRFDMPLTARLAYQSAREVTVELTAILSASAGSNHQVRFILTKNGLPLPGPGFTVTTNGGPLGTRAENATLRGITSAAQGDYFEVWVTNLTSATPVIVSEFHLLVKQI